MKILAEMLKRGKYDLILPLQKFILKRNKICIFDLERSDVELLIIGNLFFDVPGNNNTVLYNFQSNSSCITTKIPGIAYEF